MAAIADSAATMTIAEAMIPRVETGVTEATGVAEVTSHGLTGASAVIAANAGRAVQAAGALPIRLPAHRALCHRCRTRLWEIASRVNGVDSCRQTGSTRR